MNCINNSIESLEKVIGYRFKDRSLIMSALTHSSCSNEMTIAKRECYERLEFLGDAVLELVSSEYLYNTYPKLSEGKLSKLRASLVCEEALSAVAKKLSLGDYIMFGHGEFLQKGYEKPSVLCDVVEAVIGAIYLDGDREFAKGFILKHVLADSTNTYYTDYKTPFQEKMQSIGRGMPEYEVVEEKGPEHLREFTVRVLVGGEEIAMGKGNSKKQAEQNAARLALQKWSN